MINITLPRPVVLTGQLNGLDKRLSVSKEDLSSLANLNSILVIGKNGEKEIKDWGLWEKNGENAKTCLGLNFDKDNDCYYIGADAVKKICEDEGVSFEPISTVSVPAEVYFNIRPCFWYDICLLAKMIDFYAERYTRIKKYGAPLSILICEERVLAERVNSLEKNEHLGREEYDENGEPYTDLYTSLYHVGYSLLTGWDDRMKKRIDKKKKKEAERAERTMEFMNRQILRPIKAKEEEE